MARSILAIILGLISIIIPAGIIAVLSASLMLQGVSEPTGMYLVVNIVFAIIFSLIGGYLTSVVEKQATLTNVKILAVIIFFFSIVNLFISLGNISIWYSLLQIVVGPMCVLTGGHINNNRLYISPDN